MNLHDWQQATVDKMKSRDGCWAFKGAGKSPMGLTLVKNYAIEGNILIITIKSVKRKWGREVEVWDPQAKLIGRNYIIVTKEEFRRDHKILPPCKAIIFDEAHTGAYTTNGIHRAFMAYKKKHNPTYIWLMTATPILSDVTSVWGLSEMMGRPLGTYWSFKMKYFRQIPMGFKRIWKQRSGIEAQIAEDLKKIGVVLSKDEVIDLPEIHEVEYFSVTSEQKRAIKDLDKDPTTTTPIVYHTKCLQIYSGTLKTEDGHIEVSCEKIARLKELIEQNPKCVVVAKYRAELHMLAKIIPNSRIYYGDTSEIDRDEITAQTTKGECVMLLQADSGTGFDLIGVDIVVFYSHTYDYVKYDQCLGRNGGLRQKSRNTYIHLITEKTIDEDVWKCLERKESFSIELYSKKTISS